MLARNLCAKKQNRQLNTIYRGLRFKSLKIYGELQNELFKYRPIGASLIKSIGSGDVRPHLWFNEGLNFGDELVSVQQTIETKINEALSPSHLQVINESHMHSVPPGSESHFKVVIVSESFEGVPRVRRHQTINGILKDEIAGPVHALSMETLTQEEWDRKGQTIMQSPDCLGGSKRAG